MESKLKALFAGKLLRKIRAGDSRAADMSAPLNARLSEAVSGRKLEAYFQPQYDVDHGKGCGVEALARWTLEDGEEISPAVFIPLAERTGLIRTLGALVLEQACATVAAWGELGGRAPTLSVNVSTHQIDEDFAAVIERVIRLTGLPGDRLELEITESALIADADLAIECFEQWRALGVHIAVDDFGTGYSSLNYLSRLPVDRLKLDRSFAQRMTAERKTAAIVRSVLALGTEMGIAVMVEGVETERQFALLQRWGCRQVQGFLFAKPLPAPEALALLLMPWGARFAPIFRPQHSPSRGLHAA
jgi:EAL domain-containing protein (putative c-di-GMP-specific phosphodiesterase class I)